MVVIVAGGMAKPLHDDDLVTAVKLFELPLAHFWKAGINESGGLFSLEIER